MPEEKITETPSGDAAQAAEEKAGKVDLDAAAAKYRRDAKRAEREAETLKAQLEKANATLAEIEEAKKTEQEKAIEAAAAKAAQERDAHWNAKLTGMAVDHALKDALRARGYDPDFALLIKAGAEIESADDAEEAVKVWLGSKGWSETAQSGGTVPSFANAPKPQKKESEVWDADRVKNATAAEINANWDKIKAQNPGGRFR